MLIASLISHGLLKFGSSKIAFSPKNACGAFKSTSELLGVWNGTLEDVMRHYRSMSNTMDDM